MDAVSTFHIEFRKLWLTYLPCTLLCQSSSTSSISDTHKLTTNHFYHDYFDCSSEPHTSNTEPDRTLIRPPTFWVWLKAQYFGRKSQLSSPQPYQDNNAIYFMLLERSAALLGAAYVAGIPHCENYLAYDRQRRAR